MGRQLNIRSDRAYEIAAKFAEREGKPIARVVEEALEAYEASKDEAVKVRVRRWKHMLAEDRKHILEPDFRIEDMYDPETGLPV